MGTDRKLSEENWLYEKRRAAGLTQGELAHRARVGLRAISYIENGWRCRREIKRRLINALGLKFPRDLTAVWPTEARYLESPRG